MGGTTQRWTLYRPAVQLAAQALALLAVVQPTLATGKPYAGLVWVLARAGPVALGAAAKVHTGGIASAGHPVAARHTRTTHAARAWFWPRPAFTVSALDATVVALERAARIVSTHTREGATLVDTRGRAMARVCGQSTLINVLARPVGGRGCVALTTLAVEPPRHVHTPRALLVAPVHALGTLVQIPLAAGTHKTTPARACLWSRAAAPIQAATRAHWFAQSPSVTPVTCGAAALVAAWRVDTPRQPMAVVLSRSALVHLDAAKGIQPRKAGQAVAAVAAWGVGAAGAGRLAVVTVKAAFLEALVNVLTDVATAGVARPALARIPGLQVDTRGVRVAIVAPGAVVDARAEHATLARHAETLRLWARECRACLLVDAPARHLAVTAVALDTLLRNLLPVVV